MIDEENPANLPHYLESSFEIISRCNLRRSQCILSERNFYLRILADGKTYPGPLLGVHHLWHSTLISPHLTKVESKYELLQRTSENHETRLGIINLVRKAI
jgi:hypothetical protein